MCAVVYSVCGHSMLESLGHQFDRTQAEVSRYIAFCSVGIYLPRGFACKVGWCTTCSDYYRLDDIENMTAIDNYWRFKSQHRWVHPVEPGQVPRSAVVSHPASHLVRSAVIDMAACLDSLYGQVHSQHSEEVNFLHACGPKYIEAANLIRRDTVRWARKMECLNKPLPACPCPAKEDESHGLPASTHVSTRKRVQRNDGHRLPASINVDTCKRGKKKERPTPLLGLAQPKCMLTFIDDKGDRLWIPGAHRTPKDKPQSAPARTTPKNLAWCRRHGKVDASSVDMTCHRCKVIFLDESQVSPGSKLVKHHSAPAFSSQFYAYAAEGKCSCKISSREICSPCTARARVTEREELEYGFF